MICSVKKCHTVKTGLKIIHFENCLFWFRWWKVELSTESPINWNQWLNQCYLLITTVVVVDLVWGMLSNKTSNHDSLLTSHRRWCSSSRRTFKSIAYSRYSQQIKNWTHNHTHAFTYSEQIVQLPSPDCCKDLHTWVSIILIPIPPYAHTHTLPPHPIALLPIPPSMNLCVP